MSGQLEGYWIYCQRCLLAFMESNGKTFYLTNCFHIFCQDCRPHNKCGHCANPQVQTLRIDENIKPDIRMAFSNLGNMMKTMYNIHQLQRSHLGDTLKAYKKSLSGLGTQLRTMNQQNNVLKKQVTETKQKLSAMELENAKLREEMNRRKSNSSMTSIFRPMASPPVIRKRVSQTELLRQSNDNFKIPNEFCISKTPSHFDSGKRFAFWILWSISF